MINLLTKKQYSHRCMINLLTKRVNIATRKMEYPITVQIINIATRKMDNIAGQITSNLSRHSPAL